MPDIVGVDVMHKYGVIIGAISWGFLLTGIITIKSTFLALDKK
jgi:hypothetical protein